jgi:deoxyhypusine synthase
MHFGLGYKLYKSSPFVDDQELQKEKLVRIYDILMGDDVLENTNQYIRNLVCQPEFQKKMPSSELHYLLGKHMAKTEEASGKSSATMLATAYKHGIPIYTPSPCDSAIGLDIAEKKFNGIKTDYDVMRDVTEVTAIALMAKRTCKSGVFIIGGGSPKNFIMQTIPQLNDLLNEHVEGHDYFIQITDARADTGGLSGATPSEAVSWGKVNPCMLPHSIVAYTDATIALPIITSYLLSKCAPRKSKRLYDQRDKLLDDLKKNLRK